MLLVEVSSDVAAHLAVAVKMYRDHRRRDYQPVPGELAELQQRWTDAARGGQAGTESTPIEAPAHDQGRLLLTYEETARVLSVSKKTIGRLARAGDLPVVEVGGCPRIHRDDVEAYVEENRTGRLT